MFFDRSLDSSALSKYRREIGSLHKEEALLDHWIDFATKLEAPHGVLPTATTAEILEALLYQNDDTTNDNLVDETGKPKQSYLAVHMRFDGIAHITQPDEAQTSQDNGDDAKQQHHQLHVGSLLRHETEIANDAKDNPDAPLTKKRKTMALLQSHLGPPRKDDHVHVYLLPVQWNDDAKKLESLGAQPLTMPAETVATEAVTSWEQVADSLAHDEGVSEFFDVKDSEAV